MLLTERITYEKPKVELALWALNSLQPYWERGKWRPTRYAGQISEVQQIQLLVRFERKRGVSVLLSIAKSTPKDPPMVPVNNQNAVAKALQFYAFLKADPTRFHDEIAQKFGAPRPQVTQYLKLVDRLPKGFIDRMKSCNDPKTLRRFSGRVLLKIAKLQSMEEREQAIAKLQSIV